MPNLLIGILINQLIVTHLSYNDRAQTKDVNEIIHSHQETFS